MGSRHLSRSIVLQTLYEWDFSKQDKDVKEILQRNLKSLGDGLSNKEYPEGLLSGILDQWDKLGQSDGNQPPQGPSGAGAAAGRSGDHLASVDAGPL